MAPPVPFVLTGWIRDPVATRVGPKAVALILVLAARAAAGRPAREVVVVAADEWVEYLAPDETARAVAEGLVDPLRIDRVVVAYRLSPWVRTRVDTIQAATEREQGRERVARFRQRRRDDRQLALWTRGADAVDARGSGGEGERVDPNGVNEIDGSVGLWKTCGTSVGVTPLHVTLDDETSLDRARGTYVPSTSRIGMGEKHLRA